MTPALKGASVAALISILSMGIGYWLGFKQQRPCGQCGSFVAEGNVTIDKGATFKVGGHLVIGADSSIVVEPPCP